MRLEDEALIPSQVAYLEFEKSRHADVWRMATYAAANCLVEMQLKELRLYGLRPAELLVFDTIALASVQKTFRTVRHLGANTSDLQPTDEGNGTISRRRVAETTGLPRATVGRILDRLKARGMVSEVGRGRLQVPVGVVMQGEFACDLEDMFAPIILMMDQFVRLGIVQVRDRRRDNVTSDADDVRFEI
jgi:DNA-binding MarR family transcriptional regulator